MAEVAYAVQSLCGRESFNSAVRHAKAVIAITARFEDYENLADILNEMQEEKIVYTDQISQILNTLLIDKYNYQAYSHNMVKNLDDFKAITEEISKWNAVDLVMAYYHPELGVLPINPKHINHFQTAQAIKRNELITIYAGTYKDESSPKLLKEAIDKCISLLEQKKLKTPPSLKSGKYRFKVAKPKREPKPKKIVSKKRREPTKKEEAAPVVKQEAVEAVPSAKRRMTPLYSIPVTNELFHNGNVEAWKKIIQSYTTKYPGLDVYIFYEGERIHDINTLFKWGKVKHGSAILISVAGESIKDVAKLQRYLRQGASPMFEAFLKFPVNKILNLF
jgi:hypothetical protein